jgi:hypothetical protein
MEINLGRNVILDKYYNKEERAALRLHGGWKYGQTPKGKNWSQCTNCEALFAGAIVTWGYCPKCGAIMDKTIMPEYYE